MLQREIVGKTLEYRVAVVNSRLFVSEIQTSVPYLDIRAVRDDQVECAPGTLPDRVQAMIRTVTQGFGLAFAAWDLLRDEAGQVWALELNPNGQWAFTPDHAEITCAIADYLEESAGR